MKKYISLQDQRLERAVLGRKRVHVRRVTGVPVRESVEYKILQLKKELGKEPVPMKYQYRLFGEWHDTSYKDFCAYKDAGVQVRIIV